MTGQSELRINRRARGDAARPLRHALSAFMKAKEVEPDSVDDIVTAVGEALANAIEHAYSDGDNGKVELFARLDAGGTVVIEVSDQGAFIERGQRQGRGYGLQIVRRIARWVSIDTSSGTTVSMIFDAPDAESFRDVKAPNLER